MKKKIMVLMMGILLMSINLYAAGDLQVNGNIGLGTAPNVEKLTVYSTDVSGIYDQTNVINSEALSGANLTVSVGGTVVGGNYAGFTNKAQHQGANSIVGELVGSDNGVALNSTTSGTTEIYNGVALRARLSNSNLLARDYSFPLALSGISVEYAFNSTSAGGSVTATNLNGMVVRAPSGSALSVTNLSGLWIQHQTAGTNNYGIVLEGDGAGSDVVFGANREASIYASGGELFVKDGLTNVTQISPHDPETGEWRFYSKNTKTGRVIEVNMEKLVKAVEKLTGEKFMIETMIEE